MIDKVALCNQALMKIGQDPIIVNLDENSNHIEEVYGAQIFPMVWNRVLSTYEWTFTKVKDKLVKVVNERPHPPYPFIYAYPSDCYLVRAVFDENYPQTLANFNVESNSNGLCFICTDADNAWVEYNNLGDNLTSLPPLVEDGIRLFLAGEFASVLIKGNTGITLNAQMLQLGTEILERAAIQDGSQFRGEVKRDFKSTFETNFF